MDDHRVFTRFSVKFNLRFLNLWDGKEGHALTNDISAKGMGIITTEELPPYTVLEMWLRIPDKQEPLYTRGEVVWSKRLRDNKYSAGINLERADLMAVSRALH